MERPAGPYPRLMWPWRWEPAFTWLQMRPGTALKPPQKLIHLDADPSVIGKNYPAEVAIVADAKIGLKALRGGVRKKKITNERWLTSELDQFRKNHQNWLQEKAPLQYDIIKTLRKKLADDAILVAGVTNIGYWANLAYAVRRPAHLYNFFLFRYPGLLFSHRPGG